jgi:hypothetical protein
MLPFAWATFAVLAVGGFLVLAAYWLDVQDRPDLSLRARVGWSLAIIAFPLSVPAYAFAGGAGWPPFLRAASFVPALAMALFLAFAFGAIA